MRPDRFREFYSEISAFAARGGTSVSYADRALVRYGMLVSKFGVDVVGDWHWYQPRTNGFWTRERCQESALRYTRRSDWRLNDIYAYQSASAHGWLDECCSHMESCKSVADLWDKEKCIASARGFSSRTAWQRACGQAFRVAKAMGWLAECYSHLPAPASPMVWTKALCIEQAQQFGNRTDWSRLGASSYLAARKNGWVEDCCPVRPLPSPVSDYWTKERCLESAAKFTAKTIWIKSEGAAYRSAVKNGWLGECCAHMEVAIPAAIYWTLDRCIESAAKYARRSDWSRGQSSAYNIARKNGWMDLCVHSSEASAG